MAFEEQITETIEAGAPSIKYEGDIQQQQQIAQKLWENLPPEAQAQFGSFEQFFSSGAWKKVLQALQQQMEQQVPQQGPQQGNFKYSAIKWLSSTRKAFCPDPLPA